MDAEPGGPGAPRAGRCRICARPVAARARSARATPVWSASLPHAIPGVDLSDHRNYWAFGFPAVMVTDTSQYRNSDYHQSGDTWDRLDYARMAKVVDGLLGAVGCWSLPAP